MKSLFKPAAGLMLISMTTLGCGVLSKVPGVPTGECKFATGELSAELKAETKVFVESALEAKKLQADWDAEMKAFATALKVEGGEDAVLAKLKANFEGFKVKGKCTFDFQADIDLQAQLSAAVSGAASSDEGASGEASASGDVKASVNVTIEPKCEAEAEVKGELDVTVEAIKVHMPKLLSVAKAQVAYAGTVPGLLKQGQGAMTKAATNLKVLPEVKCAVEELTGFKASVEAKIDFSVQVQASASASAEASAEGGA